MDKYKLLDVANNRRITCDSLAEMVNTWFLNPSLVMVHAGLSDEEATAINNIYGMHDQLRALKRGNGRVLKGAA